MLSSRAIVLSRENFGEADRYLQLFTRDWGLISALAKSARKSKRRYIGGMDLFCHNEIVLRGDPREKPYLVELTVLNAFTGIRDDIDRAMTAGKVAQWVRKLANTATPMPGVYSLLGQTLALLEKESDPERLLLLQLLFQLKFLQQLGLKPRIDACARCSETRQSPGGVFDLDAGGLLCQNCLGERTVAHTMHLDATECQMLDQGDRFKLTLWDGFQFPVRPTRNLLRLTAQFASFHTQTQLPV
ncbi:DNA repair protein RecO [bacterium]|nr:DNA repair protein RecO [bacterium]